MKKVVFRRAWGVVVLFSFFLAACASPDSPRESTTTKVAVKLTGFPVSDGTYAVEGDFADNGWDTSLRPIEVADQSGASDFSVIGGTGTEAYFSFTITRVGTWDRPWMSVGKKFGITQDRGASLNMFVVQVPLDLKRHVIEVSYPTGFVLPRITLDGKTPSNLSLDASGRIVQVRRPASDGSIQAMEAFSYRDDGSLLTWARAYGYTGTTVLSSVLAYDASGYLAQADDRYQGWTLTRRFSAVNYDFDLNPETGFTETRDDARLSSSWTTENGESVWGNLTVTPSSGSESVRTVAAGTLSLFQGRFEGWVPLLNLWWTGAVDLSQTIEFIGDPDDASARVLEASFAAPTADGTEAYFRTLTPRLRDWTNYRTAEVTVENPGSADVRITLAVESGADGVWQFTDAVLLAAETQETLRFNLDTLMSVTHGGRDGGYYPLADGDSVKRVYLVVSEITEAGSVYLRDLRLADLR